MPLAAWIALAFLIFAIVDFFFVAVTRKKIRNLQEIHKLELRIAKEEAYKNGFDNASKVAINSAYGLVQHCNSRTNYEMIEHHYNPDGCNHCAEIREIIEEMRVIDQS